MDQDAPDTTRPDGTRQDATGPDAMGPGATGPRAGAPDATLRAAVLKGRLFGAGAETTRGALVDFLTADPAEALRAWFGDTPRRAAPLSIS